MANGTVFSVISEKEDEPLRGAASWKFPFHLVILPEFTKCPECCAFRKFNNFGFSRKVSMEFSVPLCPIPEVPDLMRLCMLHYMCGIRAIHTFHFCRWSKHLIAQTLSTNENEREHFNSNSESGEKMDKYSSMVQKLLSLSIKLVAVDFDKTIINIHTRGSWQFTSKSLVSRVRPSFKQFFKAVLNTSGLHVAVVTHSPQVPLIREVLEQALPDCDTSRIHYRGKDGKWKEVKGVTKEGTD